MADKSVTTKIPAFKRVRRANGALKDFIAAAILHDGDQCLHWPFGSSNGYGSIRWKGKTIGVHRLICRLAHGIEPSPKHHAAHHCGDPSCCNPNCLRWATPAENSADRLGHGTAPLGEKNGRAKITDIQVQEIVRRLDNGNRQWKIALAFDVHRTRISTINTGRNWDHLTGRKSLTGHPDQLSFDLVDQLTFYFVSPIP